MYQFSVCFIFSFFVVASRFPFEGLEGAVAASGEGVDRLGRGALAGAGLAAEEDRDLEASDLAQALPPPVSAQCNVMQWFVTSSGDHCADNASLLNRPTLG